ncbi:secreted RxLR effector protein 161-like [Phragmites australis]|uniref:secreted RxLR effector protein 161-like n=1 Tax=Phragmites australis TaxID=29695 RepID=UPI002D77CCC6|nr:secreted RxLR effector protein 161-like [Phragmites australis]
MECRLKISKRDGSEAVDATHYRSVIGSLRYLVNTRPDIAYAVGIASRYMEAPSKQHWAITKQILRYVQGIIGYGCYYKADSKGPVLTGYSDSDLTGDIDDRKSTSGVAFLLGSSIVTWSSKKQKVVAISSCEAEYVAAASAACQGVWLSCLLGEMVGRAPAKFNLKVDNKSTIALSKNPVHHEWTKHIDTKYHFIRSCIKEGKADIEHIGTNGQLADLLTKALGRVKFGEMRQMLGVVEVKAAQRA